MAKKQNGNYVAKKQYSAAERKSFFAGLFAGLNKSKKKPSTKTKYPASAPNKSVKGKQTKFPKRRYTVPNGPTYLGRTFVNGKFYDTNWKEPVEITKEQIKAFRGDYDIEGKCSDAEVVDMFVHHMRRKYGVYDKNGNFLYMLGDE